MMDLSSVNYGAVLVAGVAAMVIGYLWYGPLFGSMWAKLSKMDMKGPKPNMAMQYGWMYIAAAVTAYVLAHFIELAGVTTISELWTPVFWIWLGFFAAGSAGRYLFPSKPFSLFAIDTIYHLVVLFVMGAILISM